jgi:short-subunit dehydrogenase
VTGASSGIGKEICRILISRGAEVIMVSRSQENLEKAKEDILNGQTHRND